MSNEASDRWLTCFQRLRVDVDTIKGRAPHKSLLLLAVLGLLETGRITDIWVNLEAELVLRFQNY